MLKRKTWLARLSSVARWRLGGQDAEEVIADYRDILAGDTRTEEELVRDLGEPQAAAKLLAEPKRYRVWLWVFAALAVCLLAAAWAPTPLSPTFGVLSWYEWGQAAWDDTSIILTLLPLRELLANAALLLLPYIQLLAGVVLSLVWFRRRKGEKKQPLTAGFFLCGLLALAGIVLAWWVVWQMTSSPEQFLTVWTEDTSFVGEGVGATYRGRHAAIASTMTGHLEWGGCFLAGLVGMIALVKARTKNRRWSAVYVLALTAAVLSLAVIAMIWNFSSLGPEEFTLAGWFDSYLRRFVVLTVLGLIGTGVSLC